MTLKTLDAHNIRLFNDLSLSFSPRINVFSGKNASGKTTILEAISLLSTAKSFRTRRNLELLQYEKQEMWVSGRVTTTEGIGAVLGLRQTTDNLEMKAAGTLLAKSSDLAVWLPTQVIHPDSHNLVSGGPKERRRFLDWGVFHVEPLFMPLWRRYDRALRQRNAELKQRSGFLEGAWEGALDEYGEQIHQLRQGYLQELNDVLPTFSAALAGEKSVSIDYSPGWDKRIPLVKAIQQHLARDKSMGFTFYGPHRADLGFKVNGRLAHKHVSRGQQKMLVAALLLAQAEIFTQHTQKTCVVLLDDLTAELDSDHRGRLMDILRRMDAQIFVSCINHNDLDLSSWDDVKVFHVEQGVVQEMV